MPFEFSDFFKIGYVTDATVGNKDVIINETRDRHPTVNIFD